MIAAKARMLERFRKDMAVREENRSTSRLPPGQTWSKGFPVLDLGVHPPFDEKEWSFKVWGEVENPVTLDWKAFLALPRTSTVSDFHCVTTWSKMDARWGGVLMTDLLALVRPKPEAAFVIQHCAEQYTTNTSLLEASAPDAILACELDGSPLPLEHGGPMRMVIPTLYAWKSGKFLRGLEFSAADKPGFWETRGYHNRADPWLEERHER
ncbi:MAG: sulfite oxidase-like oxidoreductase [Elusimicrobia bacterium]|nr:sulfite oxidase-like oxidoreductase [Elusimicrobiota bacterium]